MKSNFPWPHGKRAALSLTFDDARPSQIDPGITTLDKEGVKGVFYVTLDAVKERLEDWHRAVRSGHEIGNHTLTHPCSGNFAFSRCNALEDYNMVRMDGELRGANEGIRELLGVSASSFAYPCGQKFVGRDAETASYVPLVAAHFLAGRGFRDEEANDPFFCDLAQLLGVDGDAQEFEQLQPWMDRALEQGRWLIFVFHDVGETTARQQVSAQTLAQICHYAKARNMWIDTTCAIATAIRDVR